MKPAESETVPAPAPCFRHAVAFWFKLGFISFGGPAGQIATMHQELVEKRRWLSEQRFLHALNYCMLLPGPDGLRKFSAPTNSFWPEPSRQRW